MIPYGKGAIGHSIPFIQYFEDTTGAGKSDKRSVLLDRIGFQKDTHGMSGNFVRGFDGWIYATHGFNNDSTIKALDGSEIKVNSGNTYRFRPDGSHIEQYTWGQVNPFGLTFDALGNLYSCDCHTKPIYQLLRGGHYPSFGKKDDGLGFAPDMMKHLHGSTANCGIVVYPGGRFPEEYQNTVLYRQRDDLQNKSRQIGDDRNDTNRAGVAGFFERGRSVVPPQLHRSSARTARWYIADFYNRIIGHYEVSLTHAGRDRERGHCIWRIVYKGDARQTARRPTPARSNKRKNTDELIALTGEVNLRRCACWLCGSWSTASARRASNRFMPL